MSKETLAIAEVDLIAETGKALGFKIRCMCAVCSSKVQAVHPTRSVWLPKSQIEFQLRNHIYEIECPDWLIKKNELEDHVI